MIPFLRQVAQHYHPAPQISRMCFIFPNKRAIAFFRKHLGVLCAESRRAIISPECLTINDFFSHLGALHTADRMSSIITLYDCYKELNPAAEPLDDFIFWGNVILSDFAEVDKYRVNPEHIFKNVAEFRQMQDSLEYLEPSQKAAMEQFLGQFTKDGDYKERFRRIWDLLLPLYHLFNERMAAEGLATEGGVYRAIADRLDSEAVADVLKEGFPDADKFVFVGLNALNECEKRVLRKMRDAKLAEFCWDFSSKEIRDPANRSSFFLSKNVDEFPQAFTPDPEPLPRPAINVVPVPSAVGQAKLLPQILPGDAGIDTAIVLPDEGLLMPVLNSIPESIDAINVTMGYPMQGSEFHALMKDIAALQQNTREKDGELQFYHRNVWGIFSNSLIRSSLSPEGEEIVRRIRKEAKYYIGQGSFAGDPLLESIFRPATDIPAYVKEFLLGLAPLLKNQAGKEMELDFAMFAYKAVTRLQGMKLDVLARTWWKLFDQLIGRAAVPFTGEPLKGLQIMGPLETRALDFKNLIILSCNEGMFPRRSVAASFIPAELRKGFGLPTYEYQDSVWAYYFYRLIQRAQNVWLLFDTRTEISRSGEESRYIRQLQMLYGFDVRRLNLQSPIRETGADEAIPKTDEDLAAMHAPKFSLSVSSLQHYLNCPAMFYYDKVKGLKAADEVSEALDAGKMGTALHETMRKLYSGRKTISRQFLSKLLEDEDGIRAKVAREIMKQLRTDEIIGRNLIFEELITRYVMQILSTDKALLEDSGKEEFELLGLELEKHMDIGGFDFVGYIDRLDSFAGGTVRIVDYKTGKVTDQDILIDDNNAASVVGALFGPDNSKRPKIALQLYLYGEYLQGDKLVEGKQLENCIYQTTGLFRDKPKSIPRSPEFCRLAKEKVAETLAEIADKTVPWRRTTDAKTCEWCDFKTLCGK